MPAFRNRIFRFLFDNLGIKVIALLMAGMLWFYAVSEQQMTRTLDVPVQVSGIEKGRVQLYGQVPETVEVVVMGKGSDLLRLQGDDFTASLNLQDSPEGDFKTSVGAKNIIAPEGMSLQVVKVTGGEDIRLNILRLIDRQVMVKVRHSGSPPSGYTYFIGFNVAANSRVMISGTKKALEGIDFVETEPVDLTDHTEDFITSVRLIPPKPEIKINDIDEVSIKVRIMPASAVTKPEKKTEGEGGVKEEPKTTPPIKESGRAGEK